MHKPTRATLPRATPPLDVAAAAEGLVLLELPVVADTAAWLPGAYGF